MADEKYRLTLEGSEIDEALVRLANYEDEGLVLGSRKGVMLGPGSEYYHKNARYYAELAQSAVPGDTNSAVRWDIDQSALTDADRELARKNIRAGGSNPNLIDNPFFTINQRGFTSSTEVNGLRIVDRWFINNGGGTVTLTSNGLSVDNTQGTRYNTLQQIFGKGDWLAGETVTLSINDGGTIYHQTFVIPARTSGYQSLLNWSWKAGVQLRFYVLPTTDPGAYNVQIYCPNGASSYKYELRSVKLEKGSVSTLANDAPPNYEEELMKCKQYFRRITNIGRGRLFIGVGFSGGVEVPNIFGVGNEMRKTTSLAVTYSGSFVVSAGTDIAVTNITRNENNSNFGLSFTASGITPYALYSIFGSAGAYIDISADL